MTPPKQKAFLAAYALVGNVTEAARLAKCSRRSHYEWLEDPDYAAAFAEAHEQACETLEAEARRRAVEGVEEPVIYQGELSYRRDTLGRRTNRPLTVRKYSDVLLIFLLKGLKPDKYRDNFKGEITTSGSASVSRIDLSGLSDDDLATLRAIASKAAQSGSTGSGGAPPGPAEVSDVLPE